MLRPEVMSTARLARAFFFLLPLPLFASGCVISCVGDDSNDVSCNADVCCDANGCWPIEQGGSGQGNGSQGGASQGGASQGGASQGAGGAGGGAPVCDPAQNLCPCVDGACDGGLSCVGGDCVEACLFDYECQDGQLCANGLCSPSCSDASPCLTGYACVGGACLLDPSSPQCGQNSDCDGQICVDGVCRAACSKNADCLAGEVCAAPEGGCVPDTSPTPACSAQVACAGQGQFCDDSGYCRYACNTLEECKLIDARFDACDANVCKTQEELSPACTFEMPCPNGEACVSNTCVP